MANNSPFSQNATTFLERGAVGAASFRRYLANDGTVLERRGKRAYPVSGISGHTKSHVHGREKLSKTAERTWANEAKDRIAEVAKFVDGWNGGRGTAPNQTAIDLAQKVLSKLADLNFEPTKVSAASDGGVVFFFKGHDRYADIECTNDGEIVAVAAKSNGYTDVSEIGGDDDLTSACDRIRTFLS